MGFRIRDLRPLRRFSGKVRLYARSVRIGMMLRSFGGVMGGVQRVAVRDMRMMAGFLVIARFMMSGRLAVMFGCVVMMLGGCFVMLGLRVARHDVLPLLHEAAAESCRGFMQEA